LTKDVFLAMKKGENRKRGTGDHVLWDIAVEVLRNGNMVRFQVPGTSMSPFIRHGEIITVKPCSHGDVVFGDIILVHGLGTQAPRLPDPTEGKKIVHRFVSRRRFDGELRLITKGDNNYYCDPPISPHQVLGRVVEIEKTGWRMRLDSPLGRVLNRMYALAMTPPLSLFSFPCMRKVKWIYRGINKLPHDHVQNNGRLPS